MKFKGLRVDILDYRSICEASCLRTIDWMSSGPAALWGFRFFISLWMPGVVIEISGTDV